MSIDVAPGGRSDLRAAAAALVPAFWGFPESRHLLPDERVRQRVLPRYLGSDCADALHHGGLVVARAGREVVGAAAWVAPGGYPVGLGRSIAQAVRLIPCAPWALGALGEARRGQAANRSHHQGRRPHVWLRAIGVDPAHQGQRVGTQLLHAVLDSADARRVGVFLFTATAQNAAWYTACGFQTEAVYRPTPTWPDVWAMWRPPVAIVAERDC